MLGVQAGVNITEATKAFTEDIRIKYYGGDITPPTTYEVKFEYPNINK